MRTLKSAHSSRKQYKGRTGLLRYRKRQDRRRSQETRLRMNRRSESCYPTIMIYPFQDLQNLPPYDFYRKTHKGRNRRNQNEQLIR